MEIAGKCTFNQQVKHGRLHFMPGAVYGFEDPDAVPYFTKAGWAETAKGKVDVEVGIDSLDIDPATAFADGPNKGRKVLDC